MGPSGATDGGGDAGRIAAGVFWFGVAGGACERLVEGGAVSAGIAGCPDGAASAGCGGATAAGALAAGLVAGAAIALTALRQGAESLDSLRNRHSRASLPPGCTLAQFAMKSERQEARTASRCAWVGCCAAAGVNASTTTQPATSK